VLSINMPRRLTAYVRYDCITQYYNNHLVFFFCVCLLQSYNLLHVLLFGLNDLYSRGAFGEVRLAFVKGSCRKVAVKMIEKRTFSNVDAVS